MVNKLLRLFLVLFVTELARPHVATPPPPPSDSPSVTVLENVAFGPANGPDLRLDLYKPSAKSTEPYPAVILIHGGGWTSLDKSTMTTMGNVLARRGFVAASVNYRLLHNDTNRWPAQLDDVQRAVRWLRAHASDYGLNPDRIGAFGHSAGAQLAALLGMEDTRDNSDAALARFPAKSRPSSM